MAATGKPTSRTRTRPVTSTAPTSTPTRSSRSWGMAKIGKPSTQSMNFANTSRQSRAASNRGTMKKNWHSFTMKKNWHSFTASNAQPVYGFGTYWEANKYQDWLNREREVNEYS